jgi:Glycosyl transferases group 1
VTLHAPHHTAPARESARVILAYKNFAANRGVSHVGLGVSAMNTQAVLRRLGYWVDVWAVSTADELDARLEATQSAAMRDRLHPVSHVVISAPWIATDRMQRLLMKYPAVDFAVVSHSNIGFLMADPRGIELLRDACYLTRSHANFEVGGNCARFCYAWESMYGVRPRLLPNLYDVSTIRCVGQRLPWRHGPLRVGIFGATRPLKNMVTAAAAAIELGARLHTDVEIWMNSGRVEGGGTVGAAVQQLAAGLEPHVVIRQLGWRGWPEFRAAVSRMHVLLSPSYTESFCMVVADGIAEGVASVVSDAIPWVPEDWQVPSDDTGAIARAAQRLIHDAHAVNEGQAHLRAYVANGARLWVEYLVGSVER